MTTNQRKSEDSLQEKGVPFATTDECILADIGYKEELKRHFSVVQVFGIAFSIMGLLPSISSVIGYSLTAGPVGMVWGWCIASACIMVVGLAMAELGSSLPTSGGLYWWTYHFAPEAAKRPLSFLCGYSNSLGLIGGLVSIDYGFSLMLLSVISLATDGAFEPSKYTVYGVFAAAVLTHGAAGILTTKLISKIQTVCIVLNIGIIVLIVIALPVGARDHLNSGKFIFTKIENISEWPTGWNFFLSWLAPIWTIGAFDSCVHMAEEASNASRAVPIGIISSIGMCWVLGVIVNIVCAAVVNPDVEAVINTPLGQPMAQIIYDCLGKKWTMAIMSIIFCLQWTMGLSILVAGSRQNWAFARDGALPFSEWLKVVHKETGVPRRTVIMGTFVALAIGCICMIDDKAAYALFSLPPVSNDLAWLIPIFLKLVFGASKFVPGPFYLGKTLSKIIGILSSGYLVFAIILLMFPTATPHVTTDTMNYVVVLNVGVWIGALAYYYLFARKWYNGPRSNLDEDPRVLDAVRVVNEAVAQEESEKARDDKHQMEEHVERVVI